MHVNPSSSEVSLLKYKESRNESIVKEKRQSPKNSIFYWELLSQDV